MAEASDHFAGCRQFLASTSVQRDVHVQHAQQPLVRTCAWQSAVEQEASFGMGLMTPRTRVPSGALEDPGPGLDLQSFERASLGMAGIAGLALRIQAGADLLAGRGEHDLPFLVEDTDLADALLLQATHITDLAV